jgi:flagellar biosynthetic protein FliR
MILTTAEINAGIGGYLWPLFRIGAALGALPMIGARFVPMRVRMGVALALVLVVAPLLPPAPAVEPLSPDGVLITANQIIIGAVMGFVLSIVFAVFVHGAQIIAMQMGLGFASMVDPENGVQVPVLSQFYSIIVTLLFLALDGHLALIEMLVDSFRLLPVAGGVFSAAGAWELVSWASLLFAGAVRVALPAIAALLLVNIAFGVMSRAAPQLNIFSIGFPISILFGFAIILFTLPALTSQFTGMFVDGVETVYRLFGMER